MMERKRRENTIFALFSDAVSPVFVACNPFRFCSSRMVVEGKLWQYECCGTTCLRCATGFAARGGGWWWR